MAKTLKTYPDGSELNTNHVLIGIGVSVAYVALLTTAYYVKDVIEEKRYIKKTKRRLEKLNLSDN
jgi:hypothetical protein